MGIVGKYKNSTRFTTHLNQVLNYLKALPKLMMLLQFLAVLIIASAIGSLHHFGPDRQTIGPENISAASK